MIGTKLHFPASINLHSIYSVQLILLFITHTCWTLFTSSLCNVSSFCACCVDLLQILLFTVFCFLECWICQSKELKPQLHPLSAFLCVSVTLLIYYLLYLKLSLIYCHMYSDFSPMYCDMICLGIIATCIWSCVRFIVPWCWICPWFIAARTGLAVVQVVLNTIMGPTKWFNVCNGLMYVFNTLANGNPITVICLNLNLLFRIMYCVWYLCKSWVRNISVVFQFCFRLDPIFIFDLASHSLIMDSPGLRFLLAVLFTTLDS